MALAITPVVYPQVLTGLTNGKLPLGVRSPVDFQKHGPLTMERTAARVFTIFIFMCYAATGTWLTAVSAADVYRTFEMQKSMFTRRYKPVSWLTYSLTPADRKKLWPEAKAYGYSSVYWVKIKNADGSYPATAAVPGTSNHGWGVAADLGIFDPVTNTVKGIQSRIAVWNWVLANATKYGLSWELQSEPWHLRYTQGDRVPKIVLDTEETLAKLGGE